jgi:hypothetical protein
MPILEGNVITYWFNLPVLRALLGKYVCTNDSKKAKMVLNMAIEDQWWADNRLAPKGSV